MSENEAIKTLKRDLKIQQDNKALIDGIEALQVAIKALEEKTMLNEIMHELSEYQAIGTVEELQDMKNKYQEAVVDWRQYRKIGTIDEFKDLKEKNEPKKPIPNKPLEEGDYIKWACPNCGRIRWSGYYFTPMIFDKVCTNCLQAIDWQ